MLSQGKELAALDFDKIIGGPLQAAIRAQAESAAVTRQFIESTAFKKSTGTGNNGGKSNTHELEVAEFDYGQMMGSKMSNFGDDLSIKVPLITMLPIPFLRIEHMDINFNVQLHSTHTVDESNTLSTTENFSSGEYSPVSFSGSVTDKNTYQNNSMVDDTYSLNVSVHAVQDQMPGGMKQVLDIFGNVIQQQSALIQQIMSDMISLKSAEIKQKMAGIKKSSSSTATSTPPGSSGTQ